MTPQAQPDKLQTAPSLTTATAATRLIAALEANGYKVKQTGANTWMAQCPAHPDRTPSLAITRMEGQILVHCHAGCPIDAVLDGVEFSKSDLYDDPRGAAYPYYDAIGRLARTVHRSPAKKFRQEVVIKGIAPLYHLDKVIEAVKNGDPVFIPEGEKCVHAIESLGVTATTSPGGAANCLQADYEPLRGATNLHIVADNDEAGLKRAAALHRHLSGITSGPVTILTAAEGKDAADHVGAGHGITEFVRIPHELLYGIDAPAAEPRHERMRRYEDRRTSILTPASQIRSTRQRWAWQDAIPLGTGSIFAGQGGEGKTTFGLHLAAQVTIGTLDGDLHGQAHNVIIIGTEDDWATVTKPRLQAAGADLDRVFKLDIASTYDEITRETVPRFPLDAELIGDAIRETGAKMLILDPAPTLMAGDMNKVQDVRQAYEPLVLLAQKADLALILINHFGKGSGNVSAKLSGSHAWRDLTRSYLAFATDPDTGRRVFSQDKNNYAEGKGSYGFTLESVTVPTDDGDTAHVARVNDLGPTDVTVGEIINRGLNETGDEEDRNAAQQFIIDFLRGRESLEASAGEIIKAARGSGFSETDIKNARRRCRNPKVLTQKSSFSAGWVWGIGEGVTEDVEGASAPRIDIFNTFATPSRPEHTEPGTSALEIAVPSRPPDEGCPEPLQAPAAAMRHIGHNGHGGCCPKHGTPTFQGMCGRCEAGV
jgi:hypothetical protein